MKTFHLTISSPEGDLFSGEVQRIVLRGTEGELAVMAGHIPFATAVLPCRCRFEDAEGTLKQADIDGGILTVDHDRAVLLVGELQNTDSISS